MRLIIFLLLTFVYTNALAQYSGENRYLLSPDKTISSEDKEFWASQTFVSIEPTTSHVISSLTFCKSDSSHVLSYDRMGYRHFFYFNHAEFDCIENILRYSTIKAQSVSVINNKPGFSYEIYLHTQRRYTMRYFGLEESLNCFFSSVIEEMSCKDNCLSQATKDIILPYIKKQMKYKYYK